MCEYARHQFRLNARGKDGKTLRETLEVVQRMSGREPDELACPDMPVGMAYLWDWFVRLNSTRHVGMSAGAITEQEISCFFSNRKIAATAWEIEVIASLDQLMLESISSKVKNGS